MRHSAFAHMLVAYGLAASHPFMSRNEFLLGRLHSHASGAELPRVSQKKRRRNARRKSRK